MTVIAAPATVVSRESETAGRPKSDWIANLILYMPLIGVTFLAKIGFELGSEIIIGVPMILSALLLGILTGRLKPHPKRFFLYMPLSGVTFSREDRLRAIGIIATLNRVLRVFRHVGRPVLLTPAGRR